MLPKSNVANTEGSRKHLINALIKDAEQRSADVEEALKL